VRRAGEHGQASVETVAMLPLVIAVGLACTQLLLAGLARELAGHAAEAGAVAALEGRTDVAAAARKALPGWSRSRVSVTVGGGSVRVHLAPPTVFPGLAGLLATTATAR
jgi:hypothetical protein